MHLAPRRRQLSAKGRPMVLRRQVLGVMPAQYVAVTVSGFLRRYTPEQISGGVQQGDGVVYILNDEIAAAAWPGPPTARDFIVIDSRTWSVIGAYPVYEGAVLIGHDLWARGGA